MHYYQHHINEFNGGTKNFTRLERWLFRDMIEMYYDKEAPLPADFEILCDELGIVGNEEMAAASRVLRRKFILSESGYRNERCDIDIANYKAMAEQARANGKKGGRPPKNNQEKPIRFQGGCDPVAEGLLEVSKQEPGGIPEITGLKAKQETVNSKHETDKVQPIVPGKAETPSGSVLAVFEYWQKERSYQRAKLDAKRTKAIAGRLKDGYSVEDLCKAIDGIARSPHHMGQNDSRTVYDDIELICRNGSKVDAFIKLSGTAPAMSPGLQHQVDVLNEWINDGN